MFYHQIFTKDILKMDFDFYGDCQPQKLKAAKINAHVFQFKSGKFGNAKTFQYGVSIFLSVRVNVLYLVLPVCLYSRTTMARTPWEP